ncbi:MAG: hypothetical protein OEW12_01225 [Deltaproteobacteria bacterium]|nr:hypothetical protein [Deltaproteobacteria bacterium]
MLRKDKTVWVAAFVVFCVLIWMAVGPGAPPEPSSPAAPAYQGIAPRSPFKQLDQKVRLTQGQTTASVLFAA